MAQNTNIATFLLDKLINPNYVGNVTDTTSDIVNNLGSLNGQLNSVGSINASNGMVTVGVSALSDQGVLDKITGGFDISDTAANVESALSKITADSNIVAVNGTNGQVNVTAGAFKANQAGLDKITGGFVVMDTAANISANLDALNADPLLLSITITDNNPVGVSVGQITSDSTAISKLHNADLSQYHLSVNDTAANIEAGLGTLMSSQQVLSAITATDTPVVVDVATLEADTAVLNLVTGGFAVKDTNANLVADIAGMAADSNIRWVIQTDGIPVVNISTFDTYRALADKIVGGFNVADTAANILANLADIGSDANVNSIATTDMPLATDVATFSANKATLDKVTGGFSINDTASNILANLAALTADPAISAITSTGGTVTSTVALFAADKATLDKITGGFAISDTAAAIQGALTSLLADTQVTSIMPTAGTVTVPIATFVSSAASLSKIAGGYAVTGTAAAISATFDQLTNPLVTGVTISDNGAVTLTVGKLTADAAVVAKMQNASGSPLQFAIQDTAADVAGAIATLPSSVSSITATGGPVAVTVAQLAANQTTLDKIVGGFRISDTAAAIQAGFATLAADAAHVASIVPTDKVVSVSYAGFLANQPTLDKIITRFNIADTAAVLSSHLSTILADHAVASTTTLVNGNAVSQNYYNPNGTLLVSNTIKGDGQGDLVYHSFGGTLLAGKAYTSFDNVYTPTNTLKSQTLYNASGLGIQQMVYNTNGSLYLQDNATVLSNGNIDYHFAGGTFFTGKSFAAFDNVTNASGTLLSQTLLDATGSPLQQTSFNPNGSIALQATVSKPAPGQALYHFSGGSFFTGKSFFAFDNLMDTGNNLLSQELYNSNGSHTFTVPGSNLTLAAAKNDTFNVTGSNDTVRFGATGFGADTFNGYKAGDVFSFGSSVFSSFAAMSQHVSGTTSAVITDAANDTLTLTGVAPSSLTASMFKFA